jgi:nitrous oxidase accessory protein
MRGRGGAGGAVLSLGLAILVAPGCSPCEARPERAASAADPSVLLRPPACLDVPAGADLQAAADAAPAGATLCLAPGAYLGPLALARGLGLWGPRDAVVRSRGEGTTLRVTGAGSRLAGFTVDGSGNRADLLDGAVHVSGSAHVVTGLSILHAPYGILVEKARGVVVRGNHVEGDALASFGRRGDPIRLWETTDSLVEGNQVEDGRDVVVWYSSRNSILKNHVRGGRYGTHLMYSHDNLVEGNVYEHGVVGVFVMYSRRVQLRDNRIVGARGSAGIGIGLKDSGDVVVEANRLVDDAVGLYVDNSPSQLGEHDTVRGNLFRLCDAATVFHSSGVRNRFAGNDFVDNQTQTRNDGGGDTREVVWDGNYFDDYAGYDLDDDGVGDVRYELRSAADELVGRYPELAFFHGTPTLGLADAASRLVPLFAPAVLLVDPHPRMAPGVRHAD